MPAKAIVSHGVCVVIGVGVALALVCFGTAGADCTDEGGTPCANGDVNGDGMINVSDAVYLLAYLFAGGPEPVAIAAPPCDACCPPCSEGALPSTGQTVCYSTNGDVIDCLSEEWPGQDAYYRKGCPLEGRFVDNGDGTLTDTCTGLMWQKATADVGLVSWQDALKYCESLDVAGHTDWRLPNIRELHSIVHYGRRNPVAIDPVFDFRSGWYWSSSTDVTGPSLAWGIIFRYGYVYYSHKAHEGLVLAVRG